MSAATDRRPSAVRGALAGAIGGLAGSLTKAGAEAIYPPRTQGQTPPPIILVRKIAGHPLDPATEQRAMSVIHYLFGTLTGAAYGVLVETSPQVAAGAGALFGVTLNLATHESVLPLLGLSDPPLRQTSREQLSEAATHIVYGMPTELTRCLVRSSL